MSTVIGSIYHTKCGLGRAMYHPDWDSTRPWIVYFRGDCIGHRGDLVAAKQLLYDKGCDVSSKGSMPTS